MTMTKTPANGRESLVKTDHQTFRSLVLELMNTRTQTEAAAVLGCTQPNVSQYLSGKYLPSKRMARKMAARLRVDVGWLCSLCRCHNS